MKKIKSLWKGKTDLEDPCVLLDRGLVCLQNDEIKNGLEMFWQAGCTNIAIIPRLILWDEPAELGDEPDDMEAWDYLNTRWPQWKNRKFFDVLTLFWAHPQVRSILGLPLQGKITEKSPKPDLAVVAGDIQGALEGKSPENLLAKKALEMSFSAACFIRDVEKENIRPPMEMMETLVEIDFLAKKPCSPGEIANNLDLGKYKSRQHAVRSINNILKRMFAEGIVEREKKDRAFIYHLSPKFRTLAVKA